MKGRMNRFMRRPPARMNRSCRGPQCGGEPFGRRDLHDPSVVHVGDGVGVVEDARVVRDDDDGAVGLDGVRGQQLHDGLAARMVQRRRRLVADDEARLVHERARDGHALLLAPGERRRERVGAAPEPEP